MTSLERFKLPQTQSVWLVARNMQKIAILDGTRVGNGDGSLGLAGCGTEALDLLDDVQTLNDLTYGQKEHDQMRSGAR